MTIHINSGTLAIAAVVALLVIGAAATGLIPGGQLLWLSLVLVCPLMMFFMMRGMGHSEHHQPVARGKDEQAK